MSTAVVSYTLNGRRGVSPTTRERVLRVADELGWRPATAARSLRSGPAAAALVVVHDQPLRHPRRVPARPRDRRAPDPRPGHAHAGRARRGVARRTPRSSWTAGGRSAATRPSSSPGIRVDDARLAALRSLPAPRWWWAPSRTGAPATWQHVVLDDGDAFAQVGAFLADLGHRRIAMVAGSEHLVAPVRRAAALESALVRYGIELRTVAGDGPERASAMLRPLLSAVDRPTAIVTDDDATAGLVLDVARRLGLGVPWDLSVVAGTDSPACYLTTPSLTARAVPRRGARPGDRLGAARPRSAPPRPGVRWGRTRRRARRRRRAPCRWAGSSCAARRRHRPAAKRLTGSVGAKR